MQLMNDFNTRHVSASGFFAELDFTLEASSIAQVLWDLDRSPFQNVKLRTVRGLKVGLHTYSRLRAQAMPRQLVYSVLVRTMLVNEWTR